MSDQNIPVEPLAVDAEDAPSPFVDTIDARRRIITALHLKLSAIARVPFLYAPPVNQGQIAAIYAHMAELSAVVMSLAYDLRTDGGEAIHTHKNASGGV